MSLFSSGFHEEITLLGRLLQLTLLESEIFTFIRLESSLLFD